MRVYTGSAWTTVKPTTTEQGHINTVSDIQANVTTVAGISSNVTSVANNSSNITTVAGAITNVNNVGGSIANVNTTATNIADVNNFAATYQIAGSAPATAPGPPGSWRSRCSRWCLYRDGARSPAAACR